MTFRKRLIKQLNVPKSCLLRQEKRKIDTISEQAIPRKTYNPLDQRKKKHYYSGRAWKKAEMMRQFCKAEIFVCKEADEKMVQENVALFKP